MFEKAFPIWIKDRNKEMHLRARFKTILNINSNKNCLLKLATSGIYNLFVNGDFIAYGPARAGKGHFRIDEYDITKSLNKGENTVVIEVCGYYATSFYIQKQPSFLVAEVVSDNEVLAFTGKDFTAQVNPHYIQKTQRYSYQRPMVEAYKILPNDTFLLDNRPGTEPVCEVKGGKFIERETDYPLYEKITAQNIGDGTVKYQEPEEPYRDRSMTTVDYKLSGFPLEDLEVVVTDESQRMVFSKPENIQNDILKPDCYSLFKLPHNATGMLTVDIECKESLTLYILFDEILSDEVVDPLRLKCANTIKYTLPKGKHSLKMFEVYTMQYVQIVIVGKECKLGNVGMIEFKHPPVKFNTDIFSPKIKKIADAAIETFRQNSVDLYVDCPSRERAGWLCDSFFTSRTEYCLTGSSKVEKAFLENFLHEERYESLPEGMFPMCYPSDRQNCELFIPQWAMWLVLELEEYLHRTNDTDLIERYRPRIIKLLEYFSDFENSDGLLEKLDDWNFVEWSMANELIDDVNYPTNMLYSAILAAADRMYNIPEFKSKSENIVKRILEQSFTGEFFCDNAKREKGILTPTGECTEVCQYYAFFFKIVTPESHPKLWNMLINDFGPQRDDTKTFPKIYKANAFIGNYLRIENLLRYKEYDKAKENIIGYFGYMAESTGTLWEFIDTFASCDHGFASYVIKWLDDIEKAGKL